MDNYPIKYNQALILKKELAAHVQLVIEGLRKIPNTEVRIIKMQKWREKLLIEHAEDVTFYEDNPLYTDEHFHQIPEDSIDFDNEAFY